jgi:hypothetical protein
VWRQTGDISKVLVKYNFDILRGLKKTTLLYDLKKGPLICPEI